MILKHHLLPKSTEKCKNVLTNVAVEVTNGYIRKERTRKHQNKWNVTCQRTLWTKSTTLITQRLSLWSNHHQNHHYQHPHYHNRHRYQQCWFNIILTRYLVGGAHDLESIFVSFKHSGYFFSGETMELLLPFVGEYFLFTLIWDHSPEGQTFQKLFPSIPITPYSLIEDWNWSWPLLRFPVGRHLGSEQSFTSDRVHSEGGFMLVNNQSISKYDM